MENKYMRQDPKYQISIINDQKYCGLLDERSIIMNRGFLTGKAIY